MNCRSKVVVINIDISEVTLHEAILSIATAETALREIKRILFQLRECEVAISWVDGATERVRLERKIEQLLDEYNAVVRDTRMNGKEMFAGVLLELG